MAQPEKSIHENHRQRVYQEVEKGGIVHWPEHRVLEYMLFNCIPRGDTNPLAHRLISRFGNLYGVLEASKEDLLTVEGVGAKTANYLRSLCFFEQHRAANQATKGLRLNTTESRVKYLQGLFQQHKKEVFYMVAMDERAKLLRPVLLMEGSASAVNVTMPKLVSEAAVSGAATVLFAHNHPNRIAIPSQDDIVATGQMIRALGMLEIHVLDHIVLAGNDYFSMFEQEKLPFFNMKSGELRHY